MRLRYVTLTKYYIKEGKIMKTTITKIFAVVLAAVVCASFAACSQSETESDPNNSDSISDSQTVNAADGDEQEDDDAADDSGADEDEVDDVTAPEEDVTEPEEDVTAPEEDAAPEDETEGEDDSEIPETDGKTETAVITPAEEQTSDKGKAVAETAMSEVGSDFLFGGDSPEDGGFDNSGVIYYALTKNGISCPRQLADIMEIGVRVDYDELSMGDLAFFTLDEGSDIVFGGVYVGEGKAVISFSEGIPVKLVDITTVYYRSNFVYGVRAVS